MECSKCGKPVMPEDMFCEYCGAAIEKAMVNKEADPSKKQGNIPAFLLGVTSLLLAVLVVLMVTGIVGTAPADRSKGFDLPEDTIGYFTKRVKAGDYDGALKACAVNRIAANYDYDKFLKNYRVMTLQGQYFPSGYELYEFFNIESTRYNIIRQICLMIQSAVLSEEYSDYLMMRPLREDDIDFDDVVEDMDPSPFTEAEIVMIGESERANSDAYRDSMKDRAKIYGADDMASYAVLYKIDSDYYIGGFTLLKYDGKWLIQSLHDPLTGVYINGTLTKVDGKSDFEDRLEY